MEAGRGHAAVPVYDDGAAGGCGRGRSGESTASVVMTGSVSTVDPAYAATPAERTLVLHLFDNLYRWTAEGAVPAAAHTYDCTDNEDGTQTYTFHLRRDGKWSDGSDVTAEDFVYAWRRLVSPETDSQEAEILSMVAGYEDAHAGDPEALGVYAEDEHTFVVTLSTMCPYFVDAVCTAAATMPVQQKAVEGGEGWSASRTWFVGNGPYRRTGDWSDSLFATLVKQEDHYNARQGARGTGSRSGSRARRRPPRTRAPRTRSSARQERTAPTAAAAPWACCSSTRWPPTWTGRSCGRP